MVDNDNSSRWAHLVLRTFLVANIVFGVAFAVSLILSFVLSDAIASRLALKYGPTLSVPSVLIAVRLLLASGLVAAVVLHRVFSGLLAIIANVRNGDPFAATNAGHLRSVGWALLAFQILDLVMGALSAWFAALHVDFTSWTPGLGGWIAVLLAFVLAGVFERGAAMRDDLASTI